MSNFCFVHGAFLGAWCWQLLIPELEAQGHRAIAVDLPLEDPAAGATRYAEVVLQSLQGIDDEIILVGHSMSGLVIPLVATQCPVQHLVFLAATIPKVNISLMERVLQGSELDMFSPEMLRDNELVTQDQAVATHFLFHDCEPDVTSWALPKLREQSLLSNMDRG